MICTCGCGYEVDTSKSRGEPRLFYSNACKQRFYRQSKRNSKRNTLEENSKEKTLYFSGIEKRATAQVLVQEKASGMMSQLLYNPALLVACGDIELVMDSGAYTKELNRQDIERYAALIIKLGVRCTWYAAPDVIGSQEKSNRNYDFLLSLLPEHLHTRILWIYQQSADRRYLYAGLEQHARLGVGGLVPLLEDRQRAYHLIANIAGVIREAGRVPHYFGISSHTIVSMLHHYHERFTVDSTTWLAGGRYGVLINKKGQQRSASEGGYDFETREILAQNVRTMRKWVEGEEIEATQTGIYVQSSLFDGLGA